MKKIILSAIAIFTIGFANAQENSIKVNPLSFFGGNDLVSFEHKLGDSGSLALGLGFSSLSVDNSTYSNIGAELQYRFYFEEALKGWYAGPNVGFTSGKVKTDYSGYGFSSSSSSYEDKYTRLQIGARGGYQWIFGSGFTLDLNLGFAYNNIKYSNESSTANGSDLKVSGIFPNFGLGLGYSF